MFMLIADENICFKEVDPSLTLDFLKHIFLAMLAVQHFGPDLHVSTTI